MKKRLLLLICFLHLLFIHLYAQTGIVVPELSAVDTQVEQFMRKWNLEGASIAVIKDERLVYARGFGYADANTPVEPYHTFRIASLSKPITAMAIMKLVQEGFLTVEDRVFGETGLLNDPEYQRINDDRIKKITIKHLLQHTAGWDRETNHRGDPMFDIIHISRTMSVSGLPKPSTIIQYLLTQPLDFHPGTRYAYSNVGYNILGRVIEKITGMSYENYVQQTILIPNGIKQMALGHNLYENKQSQEVKYYDRTGNELVESVCETGKKVASPYGGFNLEAMDAHGGWIASAADLARLLVACDGFKEKADFLNTASIRTMAAPGEQNPNYGMGWYVNQTGNWWHSGSLLGSSAMLARLNNGISWILLFNGNPMSGAYFSDLDKLMWQATSKVSQWPLHDLFTDPTLAAQPSEAAQNIGLISPNPSSEEQINFFLDERFQNEPVTLQFFDEKGNQILEQVIQEPSPINPIFLSQALFAPGVYTVRAFSSAVEVTSKFVRL